jgi:hypothetical protein
MSCSKNLVFETTHFKILLIKYHGHMVTAPAAYSEGPRFRSQPGDQLSRLRFFMVLLNPTD